MSKTNIKKALRILPAAGRTALYALMLLITARYLCLHFGSSPDILKTIDSILWLFLFFDFMVFPIAELLNDRGYMTSRLAVTILLVHMVIAVCVESCGLWFAQRTELLDGLVRPIQAVLQIIITESSFSVSDVFAGVVICCYYSCFISVFRRTRSFMLSRKWVIK
ncbi:MAG TPA: hypothetical protein DEQ02_02420 [Ruminococcaceae bacterium]|nr:hypothetical protein [Oscillospiraceae bacterium]